jgi:hypothetical protein
MAFLLGTFLTGGVLGFSANTYMKRDQVCTPRGVNPVVEKMARRLGLSPEQSARMDSILDHRAAQWQKAMDPVRPQLDSIKLSARDQMRRVLTQAEAGFEALLQR